MREGHITNNQPLIYSVIRNTAATNVEESLVNVVRSLVSGVGDNGVTMIEHSGYSIFVVSVQHMSWSILSQERDPAINVWSDRFRLVGASSRTTTPCGCIAPIAQMNNDRRLPSVSHFKDSFNGSRVSILAMRTGNSNESFIFLGNMGGFRPPVSFGFTHWKE